MTNPRDADWGSPPRETPSWDRPNPAPAIEAQDDWTGANNPEVKDESDEALDTDIADPFSISQFQSLTNYAIFGFVDDSGAFHKFGSITPPAGEASDDDGDGDAEADNADAEPVLTRAHEFVKVIFYNHLLLESGVEIRFGLPCVNTSSEDADVPFRVGSIKLNHQSAGSRFTCVKLIGDRSEKRIIEQYKLAETDPKVLAQLYVLQVEWKVDPTAADHYAAGLMVPGRGWGNQARRHQLLKNFLDRPGTIECVVISPTDLSSAIIQINQEVESQAQLPGPYLPWFKDQQAREQNILQRGQTLDMDSIPPVGAVPYRATYIERNAFVVHVGYGLLAEQHAVESSKSAIIDARAYFINVPIAAPLADGTRTYIMHMGTEDNIDLRPGDAVFVNLSPDLDSRENDWQGCVLRTNTTQLLGEISIMIHSRSSHDEAEQGRELNAREVSTEGHFRAGEVSTIPVRVRPRPSTLPIVRKFTALLNLQLENPARPWSILFGNKLDLTSDVVAIEPHLLPWVQAVKEAVGFTSDQNRAWKMLQSLPFGVGVMQGPGGSGKTSFCVRLAHILTAVKSKIPQRFVVLCPVNELGSTLAQHYSSYLMERRLESLRQINSGSKESPPAPLNTRLPVVIRLHSLGTEKQAFAAVRRDQEGQPHPDLPLFLTPTEPENISGNPEELLVALQVYDNLCAEFRREYGVRDPRYREHTLSLGFWVCVKAGFRNPPDGYHYYAQRAKYRGFRDQFIHAFESAAASPEERAAATIAYHELVKHVVSTADVVVSTPNNIGDPKFAMQPTGVFLEEASRCDVGDWAMILHHFKNSNFFLVSGDRFQARPVTASTRDNNPFHAQLAKPLLDHLIAQGYPTTTFVHQRRYPPNIMELASVNYGTLELGCPDNIPRWVQGRNYIDSRFGVKANVRFLDFHSKTERIGQSTSQYNLNESIVLVDEALRLIDSKKYEPRQVCILQPYTLAVAVTKQVMALEFASGSVYRPKTMPEVATIDGFIGREVQVVLLGLCVGKFMGFMAEKFRLVLGITRPTALLIIAGDLSRIESSNRYRKSSLAQMIHIIRRRGWITHMDAPDSNPIRAQIPEIRGRRQDATHTPQPGRADNRVCDRCHELGHLRRDCQIPYCNYCRHVGHLKDACPDLEQKKCRSCKALGHLARECPLRVKGDPQVSTATAECEKCGLIGHDPNDCAGSSGSVQLKRKVTTASVWLTPLTQSTQSNNRSKDIGDGDVKDDSGHTQSQSRIKDDDLEDFPTDDIVLTTKDAIDPYINSARDHENGDDIINRAYGRDFDAPDATITPAPPPPTKPKAPAPPPPTKPKAPAPPPPAKPKAKAPAPPPPPEPKAKAPAPPPPAKPKTLSLKSSHATTTDTVALAPPKVEADKEADKHDEDDGGESGGESGEDEDEDEDEDDEVDENDADILEAYKNVTFKHTDKYD